MYLPPTTVLPSNSTVPSNTTVPANSTAPANTTAPASGGWLLLEYYFDFLNIKLTIY